MNDKILKRARALLAMSQDATSENEAMIAMKQLHILMAKYNMSLDALEETEHVVGSSNTELVRWPWKNWIFGGVTELYFCSYYITPTKKNYAQYFVVGTDFNREFAMSIAQNAVRLIEQLAKEECKKHHGKIVSSFISSFHNGAGIRIHQRCKELVAAAKAGTLEDDDGKNLPMMINQYDQHASANDEFKSHLGLRKSKSGTRTSSAEGYAAGKEAGNRVQLNRALQSKHATKLIGN